MVELSVLPSTQEEYARVNLVLREYYELCHQFSLFSSRKLRALKTKADTDKKKAYDSFWLFLATFQRFFTFTYPQVANRLKEKKIDDKDFEQVGNTILRKVGLKPPSQNEKILFSVPLREWWSLIEKYARYVVEAGLMLESEIITTRDLVKKGVRGMI